jgi:hypothetical protein
VLALFPSLYLDSLPLTRVDDFDIHKAINIPTKLAGLDKIPVFIPFQYLAILVPVFKHIFNLSASQQRVLKQ